MVNARVHSFLENGLMLSFLTYFSGTVSYFSQTRLIFWLYRSACISFQCVPSIVRLIFLICWIPSPLVIGKMITVRIRRYSLFSYFLLIIVVYVHGTYISATSLIVCCSFFYNIGYLEWFSESFHYNLQVNARILFVDPSTRAVGLTLNKHLLHLEVPPIVSCLFCHDNQFDVFLYVYLYASDVGLSRK